MLGGSKVKRVEWFSALQTGPQNKANVRTRHPLLTKHLAVWYATEGHADGSIATGRGTRPISRQMVVDHFLEIASWIHQTASGPNEIGLSAPGSVPMPAPSDLFHAPLMFSFQWWYFRVCMRLELQDEYFSVTTFLDASEEIPLPQRQTMIEGASARRVNFLELLERFSANARKYDPARSDAYYRMLFRPFAQQSFASVWAAFEQDVILPRARSGGMLLGRVFADFRGLILGERELSMSARRLGMRHVQAPLQKPTVAQACWRSARTTRRPERIVPEDGGKAFWERRYQILWPLITAVSDAADPTSYEHTVSTFANTALYLSSLGAQSPQADATKASPLTFCIYTHEMGGWAIGRIVEQIHELGTLRLAALFDQAGLERAGRKLQEVADEIVSRISTTASSPQDPIKSIETNLGKANDEVIGGVEYRIERSRYYISQFRERSERLDIRAFGDHLAYDSFVAKRLGQQFDFIEGLWSRYDRIRNDRRTLIQSYQSEKIAHATRTIVKFQRGADFALVAFLVPYYLASIIVHLGTGVFWDAEQHEGPNALWAGLLLFFSWLAFVRFFDEKREERHLLAAGTAKRAPSWWWRIAAATGFALALVPLAFFGYNVWNFVWAQKTHVASTAAESKQAKLTPHAKGAAWITRKDAAH